MAVIVNKLIVYCEYILETLRSFSAKLVVLAHNTNEDEEEYISVPSEDGGLSGDLSDIQSSHTGDAEAFVPPDTTDASTQIRGYADTRTISVGNHIEAVEELAGRSKGWLW